MKEKIRELFFTSAVLKSIYIKMAYIKGKIYYGIKLVIPIIIYKEKNKKSVFLIFTPEHANLGDHAIAYAEHKLLNNLNIDFYEITGFQLGILSNYNYLNVLDGNFILINGGGNLGTLWPDIEKLNREIIMNNPNSTIFILPNTIYYGTSIEDQEELKKSIKIYNSHNKLYIYAREQISYNFMKEIYNNVKLIPDMVLSLNEEEYNSFERSGCIICLRNDVEKTLCNEEYNRVKFILNEKYKGNVKISDTVLDKCVTLKEREKALRKKFYEFGKSELVVTDRLHGMIFAAITGTNCIVLNSKSPKIKGCYEWIKHLNYIRFFDEIENFKEITRYELNAINEYDNGEIIKLMKILEEDIKSVLN